ncbi:MAG TPA: hypothetical protein VKF62_07080 [Planctomycetota bacterium]|nr:hypothetical protein [Planctomycetota bacterium]
MTLPAMLACLLLQQTWVVDDNPGPGVDFTDIPPAIAAAADGDILLVQPGTYTHFTLSGKGLRILGSGATSSVVSSPGAPGEYVTRIQAIPVNSVAYVDGMLFDGSTVSGPRVWISGATTRATLADCTVAGPVLFDVLMFPFLGGSLRVDSAATAWIHRSTITCYPAPYSGLFGPQGGGTALTVSGGGVTHVASSTLLGGSGGLGLPPWNCPTSGGAGIRLGFLTIPGGQAWIADSIVRGGNSGAGALGLCFSSGGPGIAAQENAFARVSGDSTSLVQGGSATGDVIDPSGVGISTSTGGTVTVHSSPVSGGLTSGGAPGPATSGTGINLSAVPLPVLRLFGTLTTTGIATVSLSNGPPNAPFLLAVAGSPAFLVAGPLFVGEILIDAVNWVPLFTGNLSAAGEFSVTIPLAGIAPGFVHTPVYLQGIVLDPSGTFWRVSNATVATIRP